MKNPIIPHSTTHFSVNRPASFLSPTRLLLLLLGMVLLTAPAGAQSFTWANRTSNTAGETSVVTDIDGDTYVLTDFEGTVSVGNATFTSHGASDILLVKYNTAGSPQWARRMGGTGDEAAGDVDMTWGGGFLYVTGSFQSTIKFATTNIGEVSPLTSLGKSDVFVAKYTLNGALSWTRRAGGTDDDFGHGIEVTSEEEVYVTGSFAGTMSFKTPWATLPVTSNGLSDAFLIHYDAAGTFRLVRRIGGTGFDYGAAVAQDKLSGNVYLTGGTSPAGSFIPNVLVARFDDNGTLQLNKQYGMPGMFDTGNDIIVDLEGVHITGYFGGTINFDGKSFTSSGGADAFVIHYAGKVSNNVTWSKKYGGSGWDEGHSLAYRFGKLYLGGSFTGTATFGGTTLTAKGGATDRDMFLTNLAADGTPVWAQQIGSTSFDYGRGGISLHYDNTIFMTGHYGAALFLGNSQLFGPGNLLTKISLPILNDFWLVNAPTNAVINNLLSPATINYLVIGTDKINLGASDVKGTVGSVKFVLDGVTKIDNTVPFTWAGDQPKLIGTDYLGFTPSLGSHKLQATPYSGPNGTGASGVTRTLLFTATNKPEVKDLILVNANSDIEITSLLDIVTIIYSDFGNDKFNVRAVTHPAIVGSVKFELDGVAKVENSAPYALAGDVPKLGGGTDYKAITFTPGTHNLVVTAYSGPNATGTPSTALSHEFQISQDGRRVSAETRGAEAQSSFKAAPNPFTGRTRLAFTATEDAPATVEVYNAQGTAVARLFEGTVQAGKSYEWAFDGTAQASGLYVARLKVGNQVLHQRLVLSK
jgi:hypothetical protein